MNQNGIREGVHDAVGKARGAADELLGDTRAKLKDGLGQAAERAQGAYGGAVGSLEHSARERPLPALALALGIGFVIGLLSIRR